MTTTTENNGRLGNQIIRNLAVSMIAKKHDLYVSYSNYEKINKLGINLYIGQKKYNKTLELNDNNYFNILSKDKIDFNLNPNDHYFQTLQITDLLYTHLRSDNVKQDIISKNPYNSRYNNNNDLFIHIRLGDVTKYNPGLQYYLNIIKNINFNILHIASDSFNDPIIIKIKELYPKTILVNANEVNTIQFGSTCKYIILSHGSFSAIIGYLSFFSEVFFPYINSDNNYWCPMTIMMNKKWNPINYK